MQEQPVEATAPPALKSRLTVIETVYHQPLAEGAASAESHFARWLETDEQPCIRRLKASEAWQALDGGWLSEAGMLCLENTEGRFPQVQPTEEERRDAAAKVLEVGVVHFFSNEESGQVVPFALIPPGESARFQPHTLSALRVRCRAGTAKYTASVFPK